MTHTQEHVVVKRLRAPLFYGDTLPAEGAAKLAGKIKVWHLVVLAFLGGIPL